MMPFRIAITGPESTGKSTLAQALAQALQCPWRREAARAYLTALPRPYEETDLLKIHYLQQQNEQELTARHRPQRIILDTEETVLRIWSEEKYNRCEVRILQSLAVFPPHLYLLTGIDLPWQPDPLREHPHPTDRLRLWRLYHDAVIHSGVPWILVTGNREARLAKALRAVLNL